MLQSVLDWLTALPPALLYLALFVSSWLENVFPPLPADTIVAFGAFLAAHGEASLFGAFAATWVGNVGGALGMLWLGRRYGTEWLRRRFPLLGERAGDDGASGRIVRLYGRYGVPALFLSRFLPGARALVPPLAGAMYVPVIPAALAISLASALWYGAIAWLAYNVGTRWDDLVARIGSLSRSTAVGAAVIVGIGVVIWLVRRRRRSEGQ
ncbi:MAG: DedA family protein [Gemmatimonadaceae bacterium]